MFVSLQLDAFGPGGSLTPVRPGLGGSGGVRRALSAPPRRRVAGLGPVLALPWREGRMEGCSAEHEAGAEDADRRTARGGKVEIITKKKMNFLSWWGGA